ncbi:hypothetical protein AKJ57_01295 [candidate division MSBL1 archaeon SCGC-AAA259A05]|uniref:DUF2283 domain-containing protein n=1 Tax=candidate division MSBL1 archaeon SCGC-AAA259A05 TaxID=1698259 RepID=A0A133UB89_9EURY|nr:hypothetical protein AKJ57_01295 [candidate division MSBL1 archaeon SCGC-AAA259A05]
MKVNYDKSTDILTIELSEEKIDYAEEEENIILHLSKSGKPVMLEILDASETTLSILKPILSERKRKAKA